MHADATSLSQSRNSIVPVDRFDEAVCAVCGRSATGVGVQAPNRNILWVCSDPTCITDAKNSAAMKQDEWNGREIAAAAEGGKEGGEYLAEMGFDKFSDMDEPHYREYVRRIITGYRRALKSVVSNEAPF